MGVPLETPCTACEGAGMAVYHGCPTLVASECPEGFGHAWGDWRAAHILPAPGVMGDQAAAFVEALRLADSELATVLEDQRKAAEQRPVPRLQGGGGR